MWGNCPQPKAGHTLLDSRLWGDGCPAGSTLQSSCPHSAARLSSGVPPTPHCYGDGAVRLLAQSSLPAQILPLCPGRAGGMPSPCEHSSVWVSRPRSCAKGWGSSHVLPAQSVPCLAQGCWCSPRP